MSEIDVMENDTPQIYDPNIRPKHTTIKYWFNHTMNFLLRHPHVADVAFLLFASQLGNAIRLGPKAQKLLKEDLVAPVLIFAFLMIKNSNYTSREATTVAMLSVFAFFAYKNLP